MTFAITYLTDRVVLCMGILTLLLSPLLQHAKVKLRKVALCRLGCMPSDSSFADDPFDVVVVARKAAAVVFA